MAYIDLIRPEEADGIVAAEYEKGIRRSGRVYNILKIMSRSPQALQTSMQMYLAIILVPQYLLQQQMKGRDTEKRSSLHA